MKRWLVAAVVAVAVAGCNQTVIQTPLRSFDRPSDAALVCVQWDPYMTVTDPNVGGGPHGQFNVRPLEDCDPVKASLNPAVNYHTPAPDGSQQLPGAVYPLPVTYVPPLGPGSFTPFLVAVVTQSARGELALVDTAQSRIVDADPFTPGFGFVPVGKLPEHVRATHDGCYAVTANSDSCDLSRVNVLNVMHNSAATFFALGDMSVDNVTTLSTVDELPLTVPTADGKSTRTLYARPSWIEMAPENDAGARAAVTPFGPPDTNPDASQRVTAVQGQCKAAANTAHKVWVALPACQALVKVRLEAHAKPTSASDTAPLEPSIEQALRVTATGVQPVTDLSTLDCPVECAGVPSDMGPPPAPAPTDMGAVDGGSNLPSGQPFPSTFALALEENGASGPTTAGRLVIGDGFGERIEIVPFDVTTATLGAARAVTLDPGTNGLFSPGVRSVRIGPRSEAGKFLYAPARDGSVHVIDLDREVECETNPDPRFVGNGIDLQQTPNSNPPLDENPQTQARTLGCFPLGAPGTPRRSPLAQGPGIALSPGQLPIDVAFVHLNNPPTDVNGVTPPPAAAPGLLVGDFAWIIASDGTGLVVDIYDACPQPNQQDVNQTAPTWTPGCGLNAMALGEPYASRIDVVQAEHHYGHPEPMLLDRLSHRLRGGHPRFVLPVNESDATGAPRVPDHINPCAVAIPPTSPGIPDGGVDGGTSGCNGSALLPSLLREPLPPYLADPTAGSDTVVKFVDPDRVRNETWVFTWEGTIPGTDRSLGAIVVDTVGAKNVYNVGAHLIDSGGAWCSRGILGGDKLVLRGCTTDSECDQAAGFTCVHDPSAFADVTNGMCLPTDPSLAPKNPDGTTKAKDATEWPSFCGPLLRAQRKYRILSAKQSVSSPPYPAPADAPLTDTLTFAEIYEPEYFEQRVIPGKSGDECTPGTNDCDSIFVLPQVVDDVVKKSCTNGRCPTQCLRDVDGANRCIAPCTVDTKGNPDSAMCGADFECAASQIDGSLRCMRAPISADLNALCMPELQQYEVHVGDAFEAAGSSSGYATSEAVDPKTHECIVAPQSNEYVRLRQYRVPLTPRESCDAVGLGDLLDSLDPAKSPDNVCYRDMSMQRAVHFETAIFNVAMSLPLGGNMQPLVPPDGTSVSMSITGGGGPLVGLLGVDVQAQQPRSVVVAPDGQTLYVVDEGKQPTAAGLRGQLLRVFSSSQTVDSTFVVR